MSQNLVREPVEDVEDQEREREHRPGDGVDPLGPVHKAPADLVEGEAGREVSEDRRRVHLRSVRRHPITREVEVLVLLGQLLLLQVNTTPTVIQTQP